MSGNDFDYVVMNWNYHIRSHNVYIVGPKKIMVRALLQVVSEPSCGFAEVDLWDSAEDMTPRSEFSVHSSGEWDFPSSYRDALENNTRRVYGL